MDTPKTTAPLAAARIARAMTYLGYGLVALLLRALIDWLTDRVSELGYSR